MSYFVLGAFWSKGGRSFLFWIVGLIRLNGHALIEN